MDHSNEPAAVPARRPTLPAGEPEGEIGRASAGTRLLIHSSERLPWSGLSLERRSHGSGTWNTPPLDGHMLCLYVGPGMRLDQRRGDGWRSDTIAPGMLQVVPAGVPSDWRHTTTGDFIALHLSRSLVAQAESDLARSRQRLAVVDQFCIVDEALAWIGQALYREVLDGGMHGTLYADSLAAALAARMLVGHADRVDGPCQGRRQLRPAVLQRVLEHIDAHLGAPLRLPDLARLVGISTSHFSALFRRSVGMPPYAYVLRRRIERAHRLLLEGMPIADAALSVGFCDQSHLARHMRRVQGLAPNEVRVRRKSGD